MRMTGVTTNVTTIALTRHMRGIVRSQRRSVGLAEQRRHDARSCGGSTAAATTSTVSAAEIDTRLDSVEGAAAGSYATIANSCEAVGIRLAVSLMGSP